MESDNSTTLTLVTGKVNQLIRTMVINSYELQISTIQQPRATNPKIPNRIVTSQNAMVQGLNIRIQFVINYILDCTNVEVKWCPS